MSVKTDAQKIARKLARLDALRQEIIDDLAWIREETENRYDRLSEKAMDGPKGEALQEGLRQFEEVENGPLSEVENYIFEAIGLMNDIGADVSI